MLKFLRIVAGSAILASCANTTLAENVEIHLSDILDNVQNGYCLDIARAQGDKANPDDGLQGHTCYSPSGELGVDQKFDSEMFAKGVLFMPDFDVCVMISSVEAGSGIELAACDGSAEQTFVFSGEGTIVPASAPDMCFTLANDTRTGRSDVNQIKVLDLQACSDELAGSQVWAVRSSAE